MFVLLWRIVNEQHAPWRLRDRDVAVDYKLEGAGGGARSTAFRSTLEQNFAPPQELPFLYTSWGRRRGVTTRSLPLLCGDPDERLHAHMQLRDEFGGAGSGADLASVRLL